MPFTGQAVLEMTADGEFLVKSWSKGVEKDQYVLVYLTAEPMLGLGLFDEAREGFDYQRDSERTADMIRWLLEDKGIKPLDDAHFTKLVSVFSTPGPALPLRAATFQLVPLDH
jgi:hypothetical protein